MAQKEPDAVLARRVGVGVGPLRTRRYLLRQAAGIAAPRPVKASKTCPVCGSEFKEKPSGRVTCSQRCARYRSGSVYRGKAIKWSEEAQRRRKERGQTANLKLGAAAVSRSPLAGPFETNVHAKVWWIEHLPSGRRWPAVRNRRKWCRDNAQLFAPDGWQRAYAGLAAVQAWLSGKRAHAHRRWKEWTLYREAEKQAKAR